MFGIHFSRRTSANTDSSDATAGCAECAGMPDAEKMPKSSIIAGLQKRAYDDNSSNEISSIWEYCEFTAKTIPEEFWDFITCHMQDRSFEEWYQILCERVERLKDFENISENHKVFLKDITEGPIGDMSQQDYEAVVTFEAYIIYDWSIYPQVRSCTRPYGWDESEDYENFRTYVLGVFFGLVACTLDTFFYERQPSVNIGGGAIQMLLAGAGKLWALMPRIVIPLWGGREFVINSGKPWSYREQIFGTIIFLVGISSSWVEDVVLALSQRQFFGLGFLPDGSVDPQGPASFGFGILTQLSFAITGFGIAGAMRTFFVYPEECVFYDTLYYNSLGRSLCGNEPREKTLSLRLKTYEMFWIFGLCNFCWYWVTNVGFQALSEFGWLTWISPNNIDLNAVTGIKTGLGINPIPTFDPNVIGTGIKSCTFFYTPWSWLWQWHVGAMISAIAIIIMWYTNVRFTKYLPINTPGMYANNGKRYNVSMVLKDDRSFSLERYEQYSEPYFSAGFLVNYGVNFMYMTSVVTWMFLYKWKTLYKKSISFLKGIFSTSSILEKYDDRFCREMKRHAECPEYWYLAVLCIGFALSIANVEHYKFVDCPVWALFIGALIAWLLILPSNFLRATTTYSFTPTKLVSIIFGLAIPHNGTGTLYAMYYAFCFSQETDIWLDNQKISHYAGIKPRSMFRGQLVCTIFSRFVMTGIVYWQASSRMGHPKTFCTLMDPSKFRCVHAQSYFNDAVAFGTIGARILFTQVYPALKWTFLIGALFPIPFWVCKELLPNLSRRYSPEKSRMRRLLSFKWLQGINELVILNAGTFFGSFNWMYFFPNLILGAIWHYVVHNENPRFWNKYSYVLYNGVTVGVSFDALFSFFATEHKNPVNPKWWGNDVVSSTLDAIGGAFYPLKDSRGYFGPDKGSFAKV